MSNKAASWLREQRTARNLSMRELALQMGLTHTTISEAEQGKASPETWKKIAEYFREPVNVVLAWAGFLDSQPVKDELIDRIEEDLRQLPPRARLLAARLVRALLDEQGQ